MPAPNIPPLPQHANQETIDRLVREVVRRLNQRSIAEQAGETNETPQPLADRVVTVAVIAKVPATQKRIILHPGAVVTPAARDEARWRNITIESIIPAKSHTETSDTNAFPANLPTVAIDDARDPSRGGAVAAQLARRGVGLPNSRIMLSETPGRDVYEQCSQHAERAVMVTALTDVDRYLAELKPTCWVLDMTRLNLVAAVNVVARIAQREGALG